MIQNNKNMIKFSNKKMNNRQKTLKHKKITNFKNKKKIF